MIKLCGFALSNYYNKVKFVLLEHGIPFEEVLVKTGQDEALLAHSPLGKVPYIQTEHGDLCESQAIVEYLHARVRAKTLFATHYFELTELAEQLSGVKNYHVSVKESGGSVVFLRRVEPGAADRSYGIEVAKLAGLPNEVVIRAREVLAEQESSDRRLSDHLTPGTSTEPERPTQLTIFTPLSQSVLEKLRTIDLNRLTPLDALNLLAELKKEI